MAKLQASSAAGFNAGKSYYAKTMRVADIKTDPEIARLFDYQEKMVDEVYRSILKKKFDKSRPPAVWKDGNGNTVLVDGHTRLAAAKKAGLEEVPVAVMEFADKDEAILYTFERQVIRRNLTNDEIFTAVEILGKRKPGDEKGKTAELLARRLGISPATVNRAKKVLKEAPAGEIEAIRRGEKTIGEVHKALVKPDGESPGEPETVEERLRRVLPVKSSDLLKAAVTVLAENGEKQAAHLVIRHFLQQDEREGFLSLLPEAVRALVSRDTN